MIICKRCNHELRRGLGFYPSVEELDPVIAPVLVCLGCGKVASAVLNPSGGDAEPIAEWRPLIPEEGQR